MAIHYHLLASRSDLTLSLSVAATVIAEFLTDGIGIAITGRLLYANCVSTVTRLSLIAITADISMEPEGVLEL